MYKIILDMMDASKVYIYEQTDEYTRLKLTVHYDFDLARSIVDILNKEEESN